jgi:hypothetical protein
MDLKRPGKSGIFALFPILLSACVQDDETAKEPPPASSYAYIQTRVFDRHCVECHKQGEDFAEESGLLLTGDVSFSSLVDKPAKNEAASGMGMKLVVPGHPEKSFLYKKLLMAVSGDSMPPMIMDSAGHMDHSGKGYGHPMPFGKKPLSNGYVEFVRQWILAGAPKGGHVADSALMRDTVPGRIPEFRPLAAPAAGTGYQIGVEKFTIPPQFEREFFIYKALGNTAPIYVNRIQIKMRPGSHHFLLYMYDPDNPQAAAVEPEPDVFRELRNLDGSLNVKNMSALGEYAYVVGGTQIPEDELDMPKGVAVRFPAGVHFDFNSHYVNYTNDVAYGEVAANLYTVDSAQVQHEAHAINMANNHFILPPNKTTVITTDFPVGEYLKKHQGADLDSMHIPNIFSHTHKLGKKFVVVVKGGAHNGDTLYVNEDWHHPPYKRFDPVVALAASDTVTSVVTYENDTPEEVAFGFRSVDEMDIIFGFWY